MTLTQAWARLNDPARRRILVTDHRRRPDPGADFAHLSSGQAILLRHYQAANRDALIRQARHAAAHGRLTLIVALDQGQKWHQLAHPPCGLHLNRWVQDSAILGPLRLWAKKRGLILTGSAHDRREIVRAQTLGIHVILVSPVFATASHPGQTGLGQYRLQALTRGIRHPIIALGGMTGRRARFLRGAWGWAGIGG